MWYDRRDDPKTIAYHVRFSASLDGGETWSPSVRVSEAPKKFEAKSESPIIAGVYGSSTVSFDLRRYEWIAGGHTAGLVADVMGGFHPFWVDNRTGKSQIWTTLVQVKGNVVKNGASQLESLDDVSSAVTLELANCGEEPASDVVSCTARVKNISKMTLTGPLKLRVVELRSELGEPQILDADNGQRGAGAVWDFSNFLRSHSLGPGESSNPKQLRFKILNEKSLRQGDHFRTTFVTVDGRVFGRLNASEKSNWGNGGFRISSFSRWTLVVIR
jgi:hypothetical protein